jgi:hypothetical protein
MILVGSGGIWWDLVGSGGIWWWNQMMPPDPRNWWDLWWNHLIPQLSTISHHQQNCIVELQISNEPGQGSFIKVLTTLIKFAPRYCCSIVIGVRRERGKGFVA